MQKSAPPVIYSVLLKKKNACKYTRINSCNVLLIVLPPKQEHVTLTDKEKEQRKRKLARLMNLKVEIKLSYKISQA